MSRESGGLLVAVLGVVAVLLAVTGSYLSYLQPGMRWPLAIAGVVMALLGAATLAGVIRSRDDDDHDNGNDDTAHDDPAHAHGARIPWLLALPPLAILLVAPAPLGADAARRESDVVQVAPVDAGFPPLRAPRDGAVDLTVSEFLTRAYYDDDATLAGAPVRLVGFVVSDPDVPDGYRLTRFQLSCCAADAFAIQVAVHGAGAVPLPDDTWVEVVGEWVPPEDPSATGVDRGANLAMEAQREVPAPENPYE